MKRRPSTAILAATILLASAMALAACATTPQAQVLRFHQNQPIDRGSVTIRPANPQMAGTLEFRAQADALGAEMQRQGFTVVSAPAMARYTALVAVETAERMGVPRRSGVSVGLGGGFSRGNVGIGTSVNVPVGGGQARANVATTTTLSVTLMRNPGTQSVWEGRSSLDTEAGGQQGTALVPTLAATLFRDFPGTSGQTVAVPIR